MTRRSVAAAGDVVRPPGLAERLTMALLAVAAFALIFSVATTQLDPGQQAGFALASMLLFLVCNRRAGRGMTLFLITLSATVSLRYIVWRVTETLEFHTVAQGILGIGLACAEAYAITMMALGYIQTAWPLERKPVALPDDVRRWPSVDVFIPTYNEDLSVVRATVLAALAMDWPRDKLQVYILDDGRRTAFRDFAESCGAGYIIRPDNKHAKAGNLNHALGRTDGEFITVFDCDHVPTRAFLQMSMGWLVQNERLAAIQTPHHFYSPDPFQRNLAAGTRVPSEGNMFYGLVQDGNDFWDAAFFCGSCAVIRRKALADIGGFATETVTEDAHTALRLHRAGWQSAYLKLPLAAGLATERLILHIGQRVRWARGMIQILRLDNPLFGPGLKLGQRLCYFNAMAHFLFAIPRIVFLTSPLAFLLLGQNIIAASPLAIVAYALPHIFHSVATNSRIQRNWRHSFWSEIYETVLALFLVRVTLITLLNPRRGRFNVTDKGGILDNGYFDMRAVYPNILLALILFAGFGRGIYGLCFQSNDALTFQALLLNTIWVVLSLLIVLAALAVGRETRQLRIRARVRAKLPAVMWLPDGRTLQAASRDLSLGGGSLIVERPEGVADDAMVHVEFTLGAELVTIPARVLQWDGSLLQLSWQVRSVAEESKVVQLVFGRADAWVDWDQFPVDRPLASLWTVLVSIRGLFRPRGRVLQEPALLAEIEAARTARTSTATLAKQTLVLRPAAMARTAVVLGLMLVVPMLANAQQGRTTVRPIPQPVPQMQTQPAATAPSSTSTPAPAIPDQEVPPPQTTPSTPTRQVVLTLHQLGAQGPMTMRGTSALQGVVFGVHSDEVVTGAQLNLSGAMSPAMIPDLSNVTVALNEQYVGTIPVNRDQPQYSGFPLQVNPLFFQEATV